MHVADLIDDLRRAYDGDPWHGPALTTLICGVTATDAHRRVVPNGHSIWELVLHISAWTREVTRRLCGALPALPPEGDWPAQPAEPTEQAWQEARAALSAAHADMLAALVRCEPELLTRRVGTVPDPDNGNGLTYAGMVRGLTQHHAYHGGQIALLRRAIQR